MSAEEIIFHGEYTHSVDGQRRVSIPRQWRGGESARFYLLPGKDKMVMVLSQQTFDEFRQNLKKLSFINPVQARAMALLGSQIQEVSCDKQGRIALTSKLKDHAEIGKEAVLVGAIGTAQIWAKDNWDAVCAETEIDPYAVLDSAMNPEGNDLMSLFSQMTGKGK